MNTTTQHQTLRFSSVLTSRPGPAAIAQHVAELPAVDLESMLQHMPLELVLLAARYSTRTGL